MNNKTSFCLPDSIYVLLVMIVYSEPRQYLGADKAFRTSQASFSSPEDPEDPEETFLNISFIKNSGFSIKPRLSSLVEYF